MARNKTYYQQHPLGAGLGLRPTTLTVGELLSKLAGLDSALPVIFRSPLSGCFAAGTGYAVDTVERETLEARQIEHPATTRFDEESGEDVPQEAYTDDLPAWDGVVIS